ncbi:MAG: tRNA (adenosine(37)-N6)-threonylcarbamoyltransferase complex dimerization subunit type 1 TsaB [Chitinophagales bacterium]|nr:tRNA (adenosine(37)-N6)-threonylcarbamoyltransferase complex dimerization subunit type 1 TsaB [Chitinophagales bacterium]OJV26251.1 MAG: tRNA (adenosine(37)-N6)-threonylcarbamoyltransferase complex dimerization subunit type 1 TsaB [Bacteroidetes bacterium 37-13]
MSTILLCIETATPVCSVCISEEQTILAKVESVEPNNHAKILAVLIQKALLLAQKKIADLTAICVSEGPGSYTGLRIGFATAKGICYAANLPLILVPTLQAMAIGMKPNAKDGFVLCPVLDARRNDVYFSFFNTNAEEITPHNCKSVDEVNGLLLQMQSKAIVAGTGTNKFEMFLDSVIISNENVIDAQNIVSIGLEKFKNNQFADLAYSEPVYRK